MDTRRSFLRRGAAAAGLGGLATVAGCQEDSPDVTYTSWLHEPGAFDDASHYRTEIHYLGEILDNDYQFDGDVIDALEASVNETLEPTAVEAADLSRVMATNVATIATGSFDGSDVGTELEEEGFERTGETSGYDVVANGDGSLAFAVGDALVRTGGASRAGADEIASALVETRTNGDTPYVSSSDAVQTLLGGFDDGYHRTLETVDRVENGDPSEGRFEGAVGLGVERALTRVTSDVKWLVAFEEESDVDTDALETWVDADEETFGHVRNVQISQQGRLGVITVTVDTPDVTF